MKLRKSRKRCCFPHWAAHSHVTALHLNMMPLSLRSSATVRSHHVPSASENYNRRHNNHSALGCGQHYHHNRAQGGQQGSTQAASCDSTDHFPSTP